MDDASDVEAGRGDAPSPTAALPPPPISPPTMGPDGVRFWRIIGGLSLGPLLLVLPLDHLTQAYRPLLYATALAVSVVGVLWATKVVSRLALLNTITAGVVVVGLVAGSSTDRSSSLGYLTASATGLGCLGVWIAFVRGARADDARQWWVNPAWWVVPVLAVVAFALTPKLSTARFEGSRTELTEFAEQQLAVPLKGDGTGRCETYEPPVALGTYRVRQVCVSEHVGMFKLAVRMRFEDSTGELVYGDPTGGGPRAWHTYSMGS